MKIKTFTKQGKLLLNIALFFVLTVGIVFPYPMQTKRAEAASGQLIQTSQADFQGGTADSSLDANQVPGDLRLKYKTESQEDTSDTDFNLGNTKSDVSRSNVSSDEGGKVIIDQGFAYKHNTHPSIGGVYIRHSFLDSTHNLLYVSTDGGGLSVINTQGTVDPADDTLVKNYTTSTTPAIGGNSVWNTFLDSAHNLLYVSTTATWNGSASVGGGLSVINTQGTVDPADDVLVKNYTTSASTYTSISDNDVYHSFLDSTHNLLYVSTWGGGLSVINIANYNKQGVYINDHNIESDIWEAKSSMGTARIGAASGVIDGKIYIAAGTKDYDDQATLEMYDPSSDDWADKASMSQVRVSPAFGVIDGKMYVVGGRDDSEDWNPLASLEVYNPGSNTWETKASMPTARIGPTATVLNGKLYVVGGADQVGDWGHPSAALEVYDPVSDTWETKASMPTARGQGVTAQAIDGKIYVAGGGVADNAPFLNVFEAYDPTTNTWETKATMPEARSGLSSTVIDGKMLVVGGTGDDYIPKSVIFLYDPQTDTWNKFTDLPTPRHRASVQIVNGDLYIIGGKDTGWKSAANVYKLPATYLSDAYQKESYAQLNWDSTTPSGTSVELLYSLDSGKTYESLGTEAGTHYLPVNSTYSLRYKAVLTTNDTSTTPSLNSVTLKYAQASNGLYESSQGTYTSPVLDSGNTSQWGGLTEDVDKPTNTSITYQTRVGDTPIPDDTWEDWKDATSAIASRDARYIQYKTTLSTTDQNQTPVLHSLTLNFSNSTYTPVLKIGNHTTLNLDPDNQITLKSPYLVFSGKVENLSSATILQIFQDGKLLKNVKIGKNRRYRFRTKPRKNQTHTYQFKYLNKDKQVLLVSPTYTILIDRLSPKITNLPKTLTQSPGDTITWSTTDNDQIDHYQITFRGVKSTTTEPSFILPEGTPKGTSHLTVRAYDRAGNKATRKAKVRVR